MKTGFSLWKNDEQVHCTHLLVEATNYFKFVSHGNNNPTQSHQPCDDKDDEIFRTCIASEKKNKYLRLHTTTEPAAVWWEPCSEECPPVSLGCDKHVVKPTSGIEEWPRGLLFRTAACDIVVSQQQQTQRSREYDHCLTSKFLPRMVEDARDRGRQTYQTACSGL